MAKAKSSGKKSAPKKNKPVEKAEDSGSDIEVIEEVVADGDDASETSTKNKRSRGKKARGGSKSKAAPARSSKRDTKSKSYKEDADSGLSEEESVEEKPVKAKKAGKKVIELAFEGTTDEDANDKDDKEEEEQLPEIVDEEDEASVPEKKPEKSAKAPTKRGKGKAGRPAASAKKSKKEENQEEEEEGKEEKEKEEEESDTEYEVERILETKLHRKTGKREFLVKWKGFSMEETTWEPEENLQHAKDLLDTFLSKVKQGDLSRTRRLSTIENTKSSRGQSSDVRSSASNSGVPLTKVREGRVSKSRSRTPRIGSTTSSTTSSAPKSDKLTSVQEGEESDEARPLPKLRSNGDLTLQKFMRESVERKLEMLKDKHKPSSGSTILENNKEDNRQQVRPPPNRSKYGRMARTALVACGAAVSVGAALVFSNPDTLNWGQISPHLQQVLESVRNQYQHVNAYVQNHVRL